MTYTLRLADPCGHGLPAWEIDGHTYHERNDQDVSLDGTKMPSRGLMVDACKLPPGVEDIVRKGRR